MNDNHPFDRPAFEPAPAPEAPADPAPEADTRSAWDRPAPAGPAASQPQTASSWTAWSAPSEPIAPASSPWATAVGAAPIAATLPVESGAGRRRGAARTVLGAALLSAVLAAGGTFGIVELTLPHSSAVAPTAATAETAAQSARGTTTTVQQEDITAVVAKAKDSVVTLTSQVAAGGRRFGGGGTATGIGSGIILTADGYVLTNRHVVEGSQSLTATLEDGSVHDATVVTVSDTQDLALVKVDATNLRPATIGDSASIQVGQTAIAIGSPLGTYTETVTKGIVSALNRSITVRDDQTGQPTTLSGLIQTDAAINPGNSGGPLLDVAGDVVGVNTATAGSAEGIGFAIPIQEAQALIDQARAASVA
jgi:S1-C subfamily serine protease